MIVTRGLSKRFGPTLAVDGIDLQVGEGERYGFLGPNGSGKTTTVRMLLGLVFATTGEIEVLGHRVPGRVRDALPDIGALGEGPADVDTLLDRLESQFDLVGDRSAEAVSTHLEALVAAGLVSRA